MATVLINKVFQPNTVMLVACSSPILFSWNRRHRTSDSVIFISVPTCPPIIHITNGNSSCTDFNRRYSECSVTCNHGYQLNGTRSTVCEENGTWSYGEDVPQCISKIFLNIHVSFMLLPCLVNVNNGRSYMVSLQCLHIGREMHTPGYLGIFKFEELTLTVHNPKWRLTLELTLWLSMWLHMTMIDRVSLNIYIIPYSSTYTCIAKSMINWRVTKVVVIVVFDFKSSRYRLESHGNCRILQRE